jgi:hypothetical protein
MNLDLLFITLSILAPTSDISFTITNYNCSYWHVNLFNEYDDKFGKLNKDCCTHMFNVECIIKPSILKATLTMNAINRALVFVKSLNILLLYNHDNHFIINFNVKVLLIPTPSIIINKYVYQCTIFTIIMSSNVSFSSSFNCLTNLQYSNFSIMECDDFVIISSSKICDFLFDLLCD